MSQGDREKRGGVDARDAKRNGGRQRGKVVARERERIVGWRGEEDGGKARA